MRDPVIWVLRHLVATFNLCDAVVAACLASRVGRSIVQIEVVGNRSLFHEAGVKSFIEMMSINGASQR